ncbi:hypothetical protein DRO22_01305 [Candidatus Bathyarchaeota archaeon]|nr:MAG: hypothetical protein DRO22_01305 [Candidatus Bathyarchaeota archaeon]
MNKKKIVFGIGIVLAVLAVFTATAVALPWEGWLEPQDSTGAPGEDIYVEQWVTYDGSVDPNGPLLYQVDIHFDPSCVNITSANFSTSPFSAHMFTPYAPGVVRILEDNWATMEPISAGTYKMYTLTFHAESSASCTCDIWFDENYVSDSDGEPILNSYTNGTFTCVVAGEETFSKDLVEGWNLVSLPLEPWDNSTSAVLSSMSGKYDAVYSYNAATKQFEDVMTGTMDPGIGYFVHVTSAGTWTYSGSAYTDMNGISLQQGLNMVGWLNCSRPIYDALSSIDGDYWYVARWNATAQEFETYNPVAPNGFNDFADMERGEGYYISMKGAGTLTASC